MVRRTFLLLTCWILIAECISLSGQTDPANGIQPFSTNQLGLDLASDNINVQIPILNKPTFSYRLLGNSHYFAAVNTNTFTASWNRPVALYGQMSGMVGLTWAAPGRDVLIVGFASIRPIARDQKLARDSSTTDGC